MTRDQRWMSAAKLFATWSKDQSRGVGAVIVGLNDELRAQGWNGFPRGINEQDPSRHLRPAKYKWTEHAERNAIYNAARSGASTDGCKMWATLYPCSDCARAIVQSGISELVCPPPSYLDPNFGDDFGYATQILLEGKVRVRLMENTEK